MAVVRSVVQAGRVDQGRFHGACLPASTGSGTATPDPSFCLAHLTGADAAGFSAPELAGQQRERGITVVCTPVSVTLETVAAEPEPERTPTELPSGQLSTNDSTAAAGNE